MRTLSVLSEKRRYEYTTIRISSSRKRAVVHTARLRTICRGSSCSRWIPRGTRNGTRTLCPHPQVAKYKSSGAIRIKLRTSCVRRSEPMNEEINRFGEWSLWARDYHDVVRVVSAKLLPAPTIRLQHQFERMPRVERRSVG